MPSFWTRPLRWPWSRSEPAGQVDAKAKAAAQNPKCSVCRKSSDSYRRYADDRIVCLRCATRGK